MKAADENIGMISRIFPDMSASAAEKSFSQAEEDHDIVWGLYDILRNVCEQLSPVCVSVLIYVSSGY